MPSPGRGAGTSADDRDMSHRGGGRGGAFAHRFGDRYRTLRVGEELRVGADDIRAVAPGGPASKRG